VIGALISTGQLEPVDGGVRDPGHRALLTDEQEVAYGRLAEILSAGGLAPPFVDELPEDLRKRGDISALLQRMEGEGVALQVTEGLYLDPAQMRDAEARVQSLLGGRSGLGPADFREALPVTRKHLIPILNYLDSTGITLRDGEGRRVPERP